MINWTGLKTLFMSHSIGNVHSLNLVEHLYFGAFQSVSFAIILRLLIFIITC